MQTFVSPDLKIEGLTTNFYVSDSDIVPEQYQNVLIAIRDTMTESYFAIGDVANELVVQNALGGLKVTDQRVFDAIGRFCGKSGRTVRYYAETASFYSKETRKQYAALAFSHFVFAKSTGQDWRSVLDYALSDPSVTAEGLRHRFLEYRLQEDTREDETGKETLRSFPSSAVSERDAINSVNFHDKSTAGLTSSGVLHSDLARISSLSDSLVWFIDVVSKIPMESENERMGIMVNCVSLRRDIGKIAALLCYNSDAV